MIDNNTLIKIAENFDARYNRMRKDISDADLKKIVYEAEATKAKEFAKLETVPGFSFKSFGNKALLGGAVALGVIGVTKAVDLIIDKIKSMQVQSESKEYFQKMLDAHPTLANADPELVAKYWASLYHFAPAVAHDPLASGAYIKQSIMKLSNDQFGGPPPETFNTLSGIQKSYNDGRAENSGYSDIAKKKAVNSVIGGLLI